MIVICFGISSNLTKILIPNPTSMKSRTLDSTRYKQGRGQGTLFEYIPWFFVHEISSSGTSWRIKGVKSHGRIHHLLSTLEKNTFLFLDRHPSVTDIREQYPLNLKATMLLAAEKGIKHPFEDDEFKTLTTDFLVDLSYGQLAISVKPERALNHRVIEKFDLEYTYWKQLGVDWILLTNQEVNEIPVAPWW